MRPAIDFPGERPRKRSVLAGAHQTSISLEDQFWSFLKDLAKTTGHSTNELVALVDGARPQSTLSSALRVFCLEVAMGKRAVPVAPIRGGK